MKLLCVVLLVAAGFLFVGPATAGCGGSDHPTEVVIRCHAQSHGGNGHSGGPAQTISHGVYEYLWLSPCPDAQPGAGSTSIDCQAAHTCVDPSLVRVVMWVHQIRNASGRPVNGGWSLDHTECRDPSIVGQVKQRMLSWQDVLSAVRKVGLPAAEVHAPAYTLVNLDTTFYTEAAAVTRSLEIIRFQVEVQAVPSSFSWHWGDGSTTTTDTPGRPYPATDITHTYVHATTPTTPDPVSVDVTYTARYSVDGGPWLSIPDPITISGPTHPLPIKQASAVIVTSE